MSAAAFMSAAALAAAAVPFLAFVLMVGGTGAAYVVTLGRVDDLVRAVAP
jgi:hypothetical protein